MTGGEYADLIAEYCSRNFRDRGLEVYREVRIGKTIIGKNRRMDVLLVASSIGEAFAIECKYQDVAGTVDEKIPYAIDDMRALRMAGCLAYAGAGFSDGVLHLLQSSDIAAYCCPDPKSWDRNKDTIELDHMLALHFKWWDILVASKAPYQSQR